MVTCGGEYGHRSRYLSLAIRIFVGRCVLSHFKKNSSLGKNLFPFSHLFGRLSTNLSFCIVWVYFVLTFTVCCLSTLLDVDCIMFTECFDNYCHLANVFNLVSDLRLLFLGHRILNKNITTLDYYYDFLYKNY